MKIKKRPKKYFKKLIPIAFYRQDLIVRFIIILVGFIYYLFLKTLVINYNRYVV